MTLPYLQETVLDPGLGLVAAVPNTPLVTGTATAGTVNTLLSFSRLSDIRGTIGYGPGPEDVAKELAERGGPVYFMRGTAGTTGSVSGATAGSGNSGTATVGVSGIPTETFTGKVVITLGGTAGVGKFKYSLDAHDPTNIAPTYSSEYTIPAGHTFTPVGSGLTFTFAAFTFVAADTYDFISTPATQSTTNLGSIATALLAMPSVLFPLWHHSQTTIVHTDASAMASAMSGHLTSLATQHRYARGILDIGSGSTSANVLAEAANWTSKRIAPFYGYHYLQSALPFEGFSVRKVSAASSAAARAARELPSSDLARFASGSLGGVLGITFNGSNDSTLDDAQIGTLRTHFGKPGFYIAKARLKSGAGSDFTDLHYGEIMDIACKTAYDALLPFLSESLRSTSAGTLNPVDGKTIQGAVNDALSAQLLQKTDARGAPGWVSEVKYVIDLTNAFATTKIVQGQVKIRPKQSADFILTNLGFSLLV
jgi:hypothetical protein